MKSDQKLEAKYKTVEELLSSVYNASTEWLCVEDPARHVEDEGLLPDALSAVDPYDFGRHLNTIDRDVEQAYLVGPEDSRDFLAATEVVGLVAPDTHITMLQRQDGGGQVRVDTLVFADQMVGSVVARVFSGEGLTTITHVFVDGAAPITD